MKWVGESGFFAAVTVIKARGLDTYEAKAQLERTSVSDSDRDNSNSYSSSAIVGQWLRTKCIQTEGTQIFDTKEIGVAVWCGGPKYYT